MTCKCFTCTHKDLRLKKAYCIGYMEACEWFLNWAKEQGIKMGSISDNDLGGVYAQINCNYQETGCYARELPDIDEVPQKVVISKMETTGKIERFALEDFACVFDTENYHRNVLDSRAFNKLNALVDMVNNIISVQEKMIDSRFVVDAVNELKGAKNE